jgi:hypothetical protein
MQVANPELPRYKIKFLKVKSGAPGDRGSLSSSRAHYLEPDQTRWILLHVNLKKKIVK